MLRMVLRTICLALAAALATSAQTSFKRLYVFGDSYSDSGAGYVDGNGPTAVAFLAEKMGLKLLPPSQGTRDSSLNYAVSGAQTGEGKGRKLGTATLGYGMRNQVDDFAAKVREGAFQFAPEDTLFYLAGGLNDRRLPSETTIANLTGLIKTLHSLGARHFRVAVLPEEIPEFSEVSKRLNPELKRIPGLVRAEFKDARIQMSNWGQFFDAVRKNPGAYGISNLADACAGRAIFNQDATPCGKPDAHFYYHAGHPSMAVHKAVGAALYKELTEGN
jgi:phospholipase/lecithinase/hemolysin